MIRSAFDERLDTTTDDDTAAQRPRVTGKFLSVGDERLLLRGVTYGTFGCDADGHTFGSRAQVRHDFDGMAAAGINAVRTYCAPPRWLLDAAAERGIWVLVGLAWEQHVDFLGERSRTAAIEQRLRDEVRSCAGHRAVLGYAIGNEIPAPIVRWQGKRRVERFLARLCRAAKDEDPGCLVTYVNFPTTEYLELPCLDFVSFNVYLESEPALDAYLGRLQTLAGERPLVMAEIGLDARRNGAERQAEVLQWQLASAFRNGAAGTFVFAWTDEWHRGGEEILDWDFGITDRERRPKPALEAVRRAYGRCGPQLPADPPRVSVVVCTYNGAATLDACLRSLVALRYPDYEVVVVDDGSADDSADVASAHPVTLVTTPNEGLSAARNTGLRAATGEIVAYTDDDTIADPDWLGYLVSTFAHSDHAGVGGPNLPPPGDGDVAACVANAPGGPIHVLLSDRVAEHIPGCNMAFRRGRLLAVGGFDPRFRSAGDDVDVCWRLQDAGETLGFHPAAVVWHHRRATLRGFWRQQRGYGRAEALLERKWPERYNLAGHVAWGGRLYGRGLAAVLRPSRVYYGTWGAADFQRRVDAQPGALLALAGMPEWYLVVAALLALCGLGFAWAPLLLAAPLLAIAVALPLTHAILGGASADLRSLGVAGRRRTAALRALVVVLYLAQPAARLRGRLGQGLVPWRRAELRGAALPRPRSLTAWFERWEAHGARVGAIERALRTRGARVSSGGAFHRWDIELAAGALGWARVSAAVEEHGQGRQRLLARARPHAPLWLVALVAALAATAMYAAADHAWLAAGVLGTCAFGLVAVATLESGRAIAAVVTAIADISDEPTSRPQADPPQTRRRRRRPAPRRDAGRRRGDPQPANAATGSGR